MMNLVNSSIEQLSPVWWTAVLQTAGILEQGNVTAVSTHQNSAFNSASYHLHLTYSPNASTDAPTSLFLKCNHNHDGQSEHFFYRRLASRTHLPMFVTCYHAAYDPSSGESYLLLADHSTTHTAPVTRQQLTNGDGVPSPVHITQIVDMLAWFHAQWWLYNQQSVVALQQAVDGAELSAVRWWYRGEAHHQQHVLRREREYGLFKTAVSHTIPPHWLQTYEQILTIMPHLWQKYLAPRVTTGSHLTLTHGDCYLTQFLCPKQLTAATPTYLIDFDSTSVNFAAYDLVYLLPTFWTPAQRRQHETHLLHRYHQSLLTHGITGYSFDNLLTDYKLMIIYMLFDAIWNQTAGSTEDYWRPKLTCLTEAFFDLNCMELFK